MPSSRVGYLWIITLMLLGIGMRIYNREIEGKASGEKATKKILVIIAAWLIICIGFMRHPAIYLEPGIDEHMTQEDIEAAAGIAQSPYAVLIPCAGYISYEEHGEPWIVVYYFPSGTAEFSCGDGFSLERSPSGFKR